MFVDVVNDILSSIKYRLSTKHSVKGIELYQSQIKAVSEIPEDWNVPGRGDCKMFIDCEVDLEHPFASVYV